MTIPRRNSSTRKKPATKPTTFIPLPPILTRIVAAVVSASAVTVAGLQIYDTVSRSNMVADLSLLVRSQDAQAKGIRALLPPEQAESAQDGTQGTNPSHFTPEPSALPYGASEPPESPGMPSLPSEPTHYRPHPDIEGYVVPPPTTRQRAANCSDFYRIELGMNVERLDRAADKILRRRGE